MEPIVQTWLALQCQTSSGIARGIVMLRSGDDPKAWVAAWPADQPPAPELVAAARAAIQSGRLQETGSDSPDIRVVAAPIRLGARNGAVALALIPEKLAEAESPPDLLERGLALLDVLARGEAARERVVSVLELVASAVEQERYRGAATVLATELAARFGCERASIGFLHRGEMRVESLSHSSSIDPRSTLARDLALAMDEAADQDALIVHPPAEDAPARIVLAHKQLAERHGATNVCTMPLADQGRIVGAIALERNDGATFEPQSLRLLEDVASLAGRVLWLKRRADARVLERVRDFAHRQRLALLDGERPNGKLAAAFGAALLLMLVFATGEHRVVAEATLEGRVQRAIVAGVDGYIAQADARPGDVVTRGQVLGSLDARDLTLERTRWAGRREQVRREHREALAGHDRTQVRILSAKIAQADAQLALLVGQLARTRLLAPFDGVIVRGDLSQSLGSPVEQGEVLFEIAPLDGYRVILKVDEREIRRVREGKRGELVLSALPGQKLPFVVERVTPVSTPAEGRNYFRVEAGLEHPPAALRPGMAGIAKISIERRALVWIWTHEMFDWLRLQAWSWLP